MGAPHVTSFCWCMGLEMGSRVIGILHLIASIILMIACIVFASSLGALVGSYEDREERVYAAWYRICIIGAVASVVHVFLAITLLYGIAKRRAGVVRAWVWLMCILFVAALLYIVVSCAMYGLANSGSDAFLDFLEGIIFFGVLAYCILCVNSYYMMLRSTEEMDAPNKVDY